MVVKTTISTKYEAGIMQLIYSSGLGALNPNTILMPWPKSNNQILFFLILERLED